MQPEPREQQQAGWEPSGPPSTSEQRVLTLTSKVQPNQRVGPILDRPIEATPMCGRALALKAFAGCLKRPRSYFFLPLVNAVVGVCLAGGQSGGHVFPLKVLGTPGPHAGGSCPSTQGQVSTKSGVGTSVRLAGTVSEVCPFPGPCRSDTSLLPCGGRGSARISLGFPRDVLQAVLGGLGFVLHGYMRVSAHLRSGKGREQ